MRIPVLILVAALLASGCDIIAGDDHEPVAEDGGQSLLAERTATAALTRYVVLKQTAPTTD